jgi:hypothetical protein
VARKLERRGGGQNAQGVICPYIFFNHHTLRAAKTCGTGNEQFCQPDHMGIKRDCLFQRFEFFQRM